MPVLKVVAGLFGLVTWLLLLGLQQVWKFTFGWLFTTLADLLDAVKIPIPFRADIKPFGTPAAWLRSLDKNVSHALGVAALEAEHLAVWLFTRLRFVASLLGRELHQLANAIVTQFLRLVTVYIPHLLRSLARRLGTEIAKLARFVRKQLPGIWRLLKKYGRAIGRAAVSELRRYFKLLKKFLWIERKVLGFIRSISKRILALERKLVPRGIRKWLAAIFPLFGIAWLLSHSWVAMGRAIVKWSENMVTAFLRYFGRLDDSFSLEAITKEAQDLTGTMIRTVEFWVSEFNPPREAPGPPPGPPNA